MNKEALSAWVESECADSLSYRQLAMSLGVSPTAVASWRDRKSSSLAPESLQAIALRRKESIADTAAWLGVEAPVSFDLPKKFNEIEKRIVAMERKVEYTFQRMAQQDQSAQPTAVLNVYLLEHGVNVRDSRVQAQMREHVEAISTSSPGLFERLLLGVLGVVPLAQADLPAAAELLKRFTGEPWTPDEVVRVLRQAQV